MIFQQIAQILCTYILQFSWLNIQYVHIKTMKIAQ